MFWRKLKKEKKKKKQKKKKKRQREREQGSKSCKTVERPKKKAENLSRAENLSEKSLKSL